MIINLTLRFRQFSLDKPSIIYAGAKLSYIYTLIYIQRYMCIYIYLHIHTHIYIYSKASLNQPTMGPTLNGTFREVVGLGSKNIIMGHCLGPK